MKTMKTPRSMDLSITNECNLRCSYCSHFGGAGDTGRDLPGEAWLNFFEELKRCSVMEVTIEGGEPFSREDLGELIEGIVRNGMRFCILSNGTLITDWMASFIASTRRCNHVQISIDGASPETHDSCRGRGSFLRAVEGVRTLQRCGVPLAVRVTIHRYNVRELDSIARFLFDEVGLPGFSTNAASSMGLCSHKGAHVQLSIEERSLAMETLLRLNRKYNGRIGAGAGPLAEARIWTEMDRARGKGEQNVQGRGYLKACGGVMTKMAVRADGVMVPCTQMSHIELGRINRDSLMDVWQHHPELTRLRELREIPLGDFPFCKACEYIAVCTGNCPAIAYNLLGKENHPNPDACLKRFLEAGGRLPGNSLIPDGDRACL
jgi:SynChlorMet cassette radical SAM/SPASM protein ScmE